MKKLSLLLTGWLLSVGMFAETITVAEANAAAKDAEVTVEGVIAALAADGAVLQDATGLIYCHKDVSGLKVGDRVRATATIGEYGGAKQLTSATYEVLGTEEVTYPEAEEWTAETMDAWVADNSREKKYVTFEATLNINNNKYFNLTLEGAVNKASVIKPLEDISAMNNTSITVTGYAMYAAKSGSTTYAYVVATKIEGDVQIASYTGLDALVAADIATGTTVEVTFTDVPIKSIYTVKSTGKRTGVYFNVQKEGKDIELFYSAEEMPDSWEVGGLLSGTVTAPWVRYENKGTFYCWELAPAGTWHWTSLTYKAATTALEATVSEKAARKVVENGVIYIIRNGVRYNALGGTPE